MSAGTGNLPYQTSTVSPFDIILAQTTNEMIANINALATGTGLGDNSVTAGKIADGAITPTKVLNPYKARAFKDGANQTIPSGYTPVVVTLNLETFDPNENYSTSNSRYTVPKDGYYLVMGAARIQITGGGEVGIKVNNAFASAFKTNVITNQYLTLSCSNIAYLTEGVELSLRVYAQNGAIIYAHSEETFMSVHLLSE